MSAGLYTTEDIYRLLPAVYRVEDARQDMALRELVEVITEQANVIAESIEQFYDDLFIETADAWVAPYIGDLIGYRTLHGVVPQVASPRAEVANTIRYRRRKGTASMLEQLARDVTGLPARAVEFFELLVSTQYMNHIRGHVAAPASMRGAHRLETGDHFVNGAFDHLAHTAEMRNVASGGGRYNIPNVGIFLWRIGSDELADSPLVAADASGIRYRFDPFGSDMPLFGLPRTETEISHIATPFDVPQPLTRRWVGHHLGDYYGDGLSLSVSVDGETITPDRVRICNLSDDPANPGAWAHHPPPGATHIAVDPVLGRVALPDPPVTGESHTATFHRGLAVEIGGGGYDRSPLPETDHLVVVSGGGSLVAALNQVTSGGTVEIVDNQPYVAPSTIPVELPAPDSVDQRTTLRASNRRRPLLTRNGQVGLVLESDTTLVIEGLALQGAPLVINEVADAGIRNLVLRHCTLVPGITRTAGGDPGNVGRANLIVLHPFASVTLDHCIVGPVVAVEDSKVTARDSVIDAAATDEIAFCGRDPSAGGELRTVTGAADRQTGDGLAAGGNLTLDECTVIGRIHATRLDVSNSILLASQDDADPWAAPVWAERRQVGCIRFSFLSGDARTPRQFHCVPRPGIAGGVVPHHTSLRFGDPGYAQLRPSTDRLIRAGADDESSMGVTHQLYEPQRETNLRIRLDEYLRFGLEAGFFYAT